MLDEPEAAGKLGAAAKMTNLRPRILIIEADTVLAEVMAELLGQDGCHSLVVPTVRDAVARVSAEAVQAVILDIDTVPLGRDDHALMVLRTWFRLCATPPPCIVVTVQVPASKGGWEGPAVSVGASQSVEWIRKPFRKKDFLAMVQRTIRQGLRESRCP